jgi:hypothetical protein
MLEREACMLIQKLLRYQTIPGPYLGESNAVATAKITQFVLPATQSKAVLPVLQSLSQQIQVQLQKPLPQQQPQPPTLRPANLLTPESTSLCKTTLQHLRQHPVQLPEKALKQNLNPVGHEITPAETVPEVQQQVLLSFLALERPFEREKSAKRKKAPHGTPYMDFVFAWEREEAEDEQENAQTARD